MELMSLLPISHNYQSTKAEPANDKIGKGDFAQFLGSVVSTEDTVTPNSGDTKDTVTNQDDLLSLLEVVEWDDLPEEWQAFMYIDLRDETLVVERASQLLNMEEEQMELVFAHIQALLTKQADMAEGLHTTEAREHFLSKFISAVEGGRTQTQTTDLITQNKAVFQMLKLVQMMNQQTEPSPFSQQQLADLIGDIVKILEKEAVIQIPQSISLKGQGTKLSTQQLMKDLPQSMTLINGEQKQMEAEVDIQATMSKRIEDQNPDIKSVQLSANPVATTKNDTLQLPILQNGKPIPAEQQIKQFENILSRAKFTTVNGIQKLSIQLTPEHLGTLKIEIVQKDQMMIARIIASTHAAKEAFESSAQSLRQAFHTQNINVDKIEIYQTSLEQKQAEESFNQREKNQSNQNGHGHNEKNEQDTDTISFFDELEAELLNLKV
ncbi:MULTISPECIES: flagellar hook-length control protein FliK [Cytobacillus]|uniref:Flagellar hook-length control protein FliK n=1 Tax=Cytobacillus stercorigallinarum TaxID=2762240 RepID=A0ABR8QMG7_9BACI|nr:flagellar hook-length control protein FliK [Cytobacillus stercorigallinarum]MBD7936721.1 flagellar hook-length control protein FliK [Cytobacillus stercorigallinarum]